MKLENIRLALLQQKTHWLKVKRGKIPESGVIDSCIDTCDFAMQDIDELRHELGREFGQKYFKALTKRRKQMLTDKDKIAIFKHTARLIQMADSSITRRQLAVRTTRDTLMLLKNLPDVCAAEIDDFFNNKEYSLAEVTRLMEKD